MWRSRENPDIVRYPKLTCPHCGKKVNAAGIPDTKQVPDPTDGNYFICFYCTEMAVFEVGPFGVGVRKPTTAELDEFASNPDNVAMVERIKAHNARR